MKNRTLPDNKPKRNMIIEIISSLLLVFFIHSIIYNFINLQSLKNLLGFYTRNKSETAWLIVITETLIALLLFLPQTRLLGFFSVLFISIFAGYIVIKFSFFPHHFGGILNNFSKTQHILFYSLLILMAITGIFLHFFWKKEHKIKRQDSVVFT